jgi:CO dehydrogenase maturation factor
VVIDNEAGMEHLSRRTCQHMDLLLVVSDATKVGLDTAGRILRLAQEMELDIGTPVLVINRVQGDLPDHVKEMVPARFGRIIVLPYDRAIEELAITGTALSSLPRDSEMVKSIRDLAATLR